MFGQELRKYSYKKLTVKKNIKQTSTVCQHTQPLETAVCITQVYIPSTCLHKTWVRISPGRDREQNIIHREHHIKYIHGFILFYFLVVMSIILTGFIQCSFTTDSVSSLALGQSQWSLQDIILDDLSCLNVCDPQFYETNATQKSILATHWYVSNKPATRVRWQNTEL